MRLKPDLTGENEMEIPLNCIFYGATETCPFQIIILALSTQTDNAFTQNTVDRLPIESQEEYWKRVSAKALELVEPYGYEHFIIMFCRNYPLRDHLSNDVLQNAVRQQWLVAAHQNNHYMHAKALCTLLDQYSKPNFQL